MMTAPGAVKIEGKVIYPAKVEGFVDVYSLPKFVLAKARWMDDEEVSSCFLCKNKFGPIRRKHHCRACGNIFCKNCCNEKYILPHLGFKKPERVCELCQPVTGLLAKSCSDQQSVIVEAAADLSEMLQESRNIAKVVELGGIQTLISLANIDQDEMQESVVKGLHNLSTHQPLHTLLIESGAIKAVCHILERSEASHVTLQEGVSTLIIFCKSKELRLKVLEDGALTPVLKLCNMNDEVGLLAVSALSLIVEQPEAHSAVIENHQNSLAQILNLTAAFDEQLQEVALKTLAHLSMGTNCHRHRIIQEDFTSGHNLKAVIQSSPDNVQVLCNAACVVANLSVNPDDRKVLSDLFECLCVMLHEDLNQDVLFHVIRGIANFAKYKENAGTLVKYLPLIIDKCVRSNNDRIHAHGLRATMFLLVNNPDPVVQQLMRNGSLEILYGFAILPGLANSIESALLSRSPALSKPQ